MGKNDKTALGRALVKHHNHMIQEGLDKNRFYKIQNHQRVLESVTDVTDIDAVIERAEEADRFFSYDHPAPTLPINLDTSSNFADLTLEEHKKQHEKEEALHASSLRVPRRPPWKTEMTVEELDKNEKEAFLAWRRKLASLEANEMLVLTPFEKNLDIWRQLWRVVEKSDLLVMVVDARDPLFYRCPDIEAYAREVDSSKRTLLLINKADLVPLSVRERWAEYFERHDILFAFWSAKAAAAPLQQKSDDSIAKIYGRDELLSRLQSTAERIASLTEGAPRNAVAGFVGYPNVGKSSTINALVGRKRTAVTSTPGKTKHFQTLVIEGTRLTLCDCPGLVFPSFSGSRYEMIASGVLPVDRMTKHREAVRIVAERVSRTVLESTYNISLPRPRSHEAQNRAPSAAELLAAYCGSRGYVSSGGIPDEARAARRILRDFIEGKLVHYREAPGVEGGDGGADLFEKGDLKGVMEDMNMFESGDAGIARRRETKEAGAAHKRHMKNPRKKDRSWRVGNGGGYGVAVVRGFHNIDRLKA